MTAARLRGAIVATAIFLSLAGCATTPTDELVESLDPKTAVTVVALSEPLLFTSARSTPTRPDDVALGPFEINRMGTKTWYLWANRLGELPASASLARLRIVANGETLLELDPLVADAKLPLSSAPYASMAAWATVAYYAVTAEELARLQGRSALAVELPAGPQGEWVRFEAWQGQVAAIDQFVVRQLSGRVAGRK